MRLRVASLLIATALLSACGGDDGAITTSSKKEAPAASDASLTEEQCAVFSSDDGPTKGFVEAMPADHRDAAQAILDFTDAMEGMSDNDEDGTIDALVEALTKNGVAEQLEDFAAFVEEECGQSEGSVIIGGMATASIMASADKDDEYCDAIEAGFATDDGGPEEIAGLVDIAPESHREPLSVLKDIDPESMNADDQDKVFGPLFGLGVYAESACKIDGALVQMLLGAMFMGMGEDSGGDDTSTTLPEGVDPAQYPDITADSANAALPAGSDLTFSVHSADLDDDGEYLASMIVPEGWESTSTFNIEFSPPAGSGASIFTSIEAGAGCDGTCEANDWDARLRGETGYLTQYFDAHPSATESPIAGSEGVVIVDESEVSALVVRWDDNADKYFSCEVTLEEGQGDLLPAFVAACEASRPAWFLVSA